MSQTVEERKRILDANFNEIKFLLSRVLGKVMAKRKWKGTFNWQGEIHELWTSAFHLIEAESNMFTQLARKLNTTTYAVRNYFLGKAQSYEVTEHERK